MAQHASTEDRSVPAPRTRGWSEDWLAVVAGAAVFVLALGLLFGSNLLGWVTGPRTWLEIGKSVRPVSSAYAQVDALLLLLVTYAFVLALMTAAAALLGMSIPKFIAGFTLLYWLSYLSWVLGNYAYIAVTTPAEMQRLGLGWSLRLTGEFGYVLALLIGLAIANLLPTAARWLAEAARAELFIKTAIVILGGTVGVKAAEQLGFATHIMLRGLAAIIEAYLVYWAVVYFVARKWFGFSREWAAPLASGISICGVSAAIATGSAIRARPVVPIMVASLVVIFAVVELLILPFAAQSFLSHEPMVAGAWMGLAVKTDGAAVASGGITESLILASAAARGVNFEKGWILGTTTTVKVFIDVFIGIWAFILAYIWTTHIDVRQGDTARVAEIWVRFPKFIIGYILTFAVILLMALGATPNFAAKLKSAMGEANTFRGIFFVMTFFTIGVMTNFRKLWEEGIGKLAAVYLLCLFGFVIWVGVLISWLFYAGVKPPLAG